MLPVTLELGGKSAAIVLDDADLDATMRALKYVSFVNNGPHVSPISPRRRC
jgi:acyl-CoA reductase-like NAD-dependent aldehyde dehydrogenase